jgi:hypothetical protein
VGIARNFAVVSSIHIAITFPELFCLTFPAGGVTLGTLLKLNNVLLEVQLLHLFGVMVVAPIAAVLGVAALVACLARNLTLTAMFKVKDVSRQ